MATLPRMCSSEVHSYHRRSVSSSDLYLNDDRSMIHSQSLSTEEGIPKADNPLKDIFAFLGSRSTSPPASSASRKATEWPCLLMRLVLSPVHYARYTYRYGSRYLVTGGRWLRRTLDPVLGHISRNYQIIPVSPTPEKGGANWGSSPPILIFSALVFVFVIYRICGDRWVFCAQLTRYIQGQTNPVNLSNPEHHMIYHMEGMNSSLELTPYRKDQADIFRVSFTHPNGTPVPLYKYISTLKEGYEGKTFVYESVPLNNTMVVFKQFFAMTRSQPVPRDIRSKVLSEARALNRIITGASDWTSGMSILVEEGNLWGWSPSGPDGKMSKSDKTRRDHRMEWPVEVVATMRQWTPFREVIKRLEKEMNHTGRGSPKKIERWSIEEEQEEGELVRALDVFYVPNFQIKDVGVEDKPKKKALTGSWKRKRSQPTQQTAEDLSKEEWLESVALQDAAGLVEEMKSEELAERREVSGGPNATLTREKNVKRILRSLSTDIESWGMILPFLDGGDADHLAAILPLIGLSPADLDWLYRPLFAHGVLKALARMHHTKEDEQDRNQFQWQLISGAWYSELGSEFTSSNKQHAGIQGIPRARRPQRIDDNAQGYCHGDVKLDNIFIRRVASEKKATIETTISDADAASHQPKQLEDYLAIMETEKAHPSLEPPRGPRHYLVLADLSQTRPLHHIHHIRQNWRDCRLVDMDRAWRSYLQLLRMGSRTRRDRNGGESPTKRFDKVFLKWRSAFIGNNGVLASQSQMVEDVKIARVGLQAHTELVGSEDYVGAYFTWLTNPQIPSSFFLPHKTTKAQSVSTSDFWTRELPPTRNVSIMGSPLREMSRSQVFSVIDGLKGEVKLIKENRARGKPISIPSWYYEFGGEGKTRPGGGEQSEEKETEEEVLVGQGLQVLQGPLMGM